MTRSSQRVRLFSFGLLIGLTVWAARPAEAAVAIPLSPTTATQSNVISETLSANASVAGNTIVGERGWAISGAVGTAPFAVFPTMSPYDSGPLNTDYVFTLDFDDVPKLILGKFQLEATSDANPTVSSGATWTALTPLSVASATGSSLSIVDGTVIKYTSDTAAIPDNDKYTIVVGDPGLSNITGFRVTTFNDVDLPGGSGGPGLSDNGNFVLSEINAQSQMNITGNATFIRSDLVDTNYDTDSHGLIIGGEGPDKRIRGLLSFDLSQVPDDMDFADVQLDMFIKTLDGSASADRDVTWEVRALASSFVEDEATWNNAAQSQPWNAAGGDFNTDAADLLATLTVNTGNGSINPGDLLSFQSTSGGAFKNLVADAIANDETLYLVVYAPEAEVGSQRNFLFVHSDDTGAALGLAPKLVFVVPEPATWVLLALGTVCLVATRFGRQRLTA